MEVRSFTLDSLTLGKKSFCSCATTSVESLKPALFFDVVLPSFDMAVAEVKLGGWLCPLAVDFNS